MSDRAPKVENPFTVFAFLNAVLVVLIATGCGLSLVIFTVLKLTNTVDWSWLWVLAPAWVPWLILTVTVLGALILAIARGTGHVEVHPQRNKIGRF